MTSSPISEEERKVWRDCWQCSGNGRIAGCFEDTCVCGGDDDPDTCCSPRRCDICRGKGGFYVPLSAITDEGDIP